MKEKKLGKGLNLLFGENEGLGETQAEIIVQDRAHESTKQAPAQRMIDLSLSQIYPNKSQPRKVFNEEAINQLSVSIRTEGVVQPVLVRTRGDSFELVSGERRWRAAQRAELKTIPAIIIDADDNRSLQIALIENIQREDLNSIEKAKAFRDLIEKTGCTQEELSDRIGQDRSTIANVIRLLELPLEIQDSVSRGTISMGHARALLAINGEKQQRDLAKRIEKDGISVRKLESLVRLSMKKSSRRFSTSKDPIMGEIADKLTEFFGTRVTIEAGKKRGRILIDYYETSQLNGILSKLNIVV